MAFLILAYWCHFKSHLAEEFVAWHCDVLVFGIFEILVFGIWYFYSEIRHLT